MKYTLLSISVQFHMNTRVVKLRVFDSLQIKHVITIETNKTITINFVKESICKYFNDINCFVTIPVRIKHLLEHRNNTLWLKETK